MSKLEKMNQVEKVLSEFSKEAQINYYINKETLKIGMCKKLENALGTYDAYDNVIRLARNESFEHELFHMAFNNRNKYLTEIRPSIFLGNGVTYIEENGKTHGMGLTEGLAESLAVKSKNNSKGRFFQYQIINILVSIYGNEVYEFALKNDPIGFYEFFSNNIETIRDSLDLYTEILSTVNSLSEKNKEKELEEYEKNVIRQVFKVYVPNIIYECINGIINEYNVCENPNITRIELQKQIKDILSSEKFEVMKYSNIFKINLIEEIDKLIDTKLIIKNYRK